MDKKTLLENIGKLSDDLSDLIDSAYELNLGSDEILSRLAKINSAMAKLADVDEFEIEDQVNRPSHYKREDAIECIEEMRMVFGDKAVMDFCKCNVWKYRYRAGQKDGESGEKDLSKSDWYMREFEKLNALADEELPWV